MKYTEYFLYTHNRKDRVAIKEEYIEYVINNYIMKKKKFNTMEESAVGIYTSRKQVFASYTYARWNNRTQRILR